MSTGFAGMAVLVIVKDKALLKCYYDSPDVHTDERGQTRPDKARECQSETNFFVS